HRRAAAGQHRPGVALPVPPLGRRHLGEPRRAADGRPLRRRRLRPRQQQPQPRRGRRRQGAARAGPGRGHGEQRQPAAAAVAPAPRVAAAPLRVVPGLLPSDRAARGAGARRRRRRRRRRLRGGRQRRGPVARAGGRGLRLRVIWRDLT
ncbi:MAG: hypothetical protein J3K34DRAFT_522945, partial [Monoraphidium minutum]